MTKNVLCVVVTYNRYLELKRNIGALQKQSYPIKELMIIDNASSDNTSTYCKKLQNDCVVPITYVRLPTNTGGAGGFYEGIKRFHDGDCDMVWLMDDDGRPIGDDSLSQIMTHAESLYESNKLLMLNSLVIYDENTLSFPMKGYEDPCTIVALSHAGLFEDGISPFNGTLISRELVNTIGYPEKEFFIGFDETYYYLKAKKAGAYIATVCDSLYYHPKPVKESHTKSFLGRTLIPADRAPWREYYAIRNRTYYLAREDSLKSCFNLFARRLLEVGLRNGEKRKTYTMVAKGFIDGLTGKLGKRVDPSQ